MLKRIIMTLSILTTLSILAGCQKRQVSVKVPKQSDESLMITTNYHQNSKQVALLEQFLTKQMVKNGGVYTNYKNGTQTEEVATGHEMLSESSGLWLEYLAKTHQNQKFRQFYTAMKQKFDQGNQFSYRYDPKTKKKSNVNATLDDLRIIRALQIYAQNTNSKKYRHEAAKRFALLQTTSIQGERVLNFYDAKSKKAKNQGSLAYYDLATLKYFESVTAKGKKDYQKQLKLVQKGYLGDIFPLYAPSYNWDDNQYEMATMNTSEALMTVLHLAEVGKVKQSTLEWLKIQIDQKQLANSYTTAGVVQSHDQSSGNYALAAMIFAEAGNQKYYNKAMKLVWNDQVTDRDAKIYGALGDAKTNDAYSFNNLLALVTAQY